MITSSISIQESAANIWQALTLKEEFKQWYFDIPDFELSVGSTFDFYEPGDEKKYLHRCTLIEIIPYKKLSYTWTHPDYSKGVTTVTWLLEEKDGVTDVTLRHQGLNHIQDAGSQFAPENYQQGWDEILANLKKYLIKTA